MKLKAIAQSVINRFYHFFSRPKIHKETENPRQFFLAGQKNSIFGAFFELLEYLLKGLNYLFAQTQETPVMVEPPAAEQPVPAAVTNSWEGAAGNNTVANNNNLPGQPNQNLARHRVEQSIIGKNIELKRYNHLHRVLMDIWNSGTDSTGKVLTAEEISSLRQKLRLTLDEQLRLTLEIERLEGILQDMRREIVAIAQEQAQRQPQGPEVNLNADHNPPQAGLNAGQPEEPNQLENRHRWRSLLRNPWVIVGLGVGVAAIGLVYLGPAAIALIVA
jgi:hypothetical protein